MSDEPFSTDQDDISQKSSEDEVPIILTKRQFAKRVGRGEELESVIPEGNQAHQIAKT